MTEIKLGESEEDEEWQQQLYINRSSHSFSLQKGVLKNFAKFTGKQLCKSLFFNKVAWLLRPAT